LCRRLIKITDDDRGDFVLHEEGDSLCRWYQSLDKKRAREKRGELARLKKEPETEDGWTKWFRPYMKRYRLGCCDCGLVHNVDFRIVREGRRFHVEIRAQRNYRSTAGCRRNLSIRISRRTR